MNRRDFLVAAGWAGVVPALHGSGVSGAAHTRWGPPIGGYWVGVCAARRSGAHQPGERDARRACRSSRRRAPIGERVTHLEAMGGCSPASRRGSSWPPTRRAEGRLAREVRRPRAPRDRARGRSRVARLLNFTRAAAARGRRVSGAGDAARPARAARALDAATTKHLVEALEATRVISPGFNNWLLFSATVEAALAKLGARWDRMRVDYALRQHEQWYKGDGAYGDGPAFHWDYYNSFVIQPMLLDVLDVVPRRDRRPGRISPRGSSRGPALRGHPRAADRARRIVPPIGRSIAYRFGAFQLLAQIALRPRCPRAFAGAGARRADRDDSQDDGCARARSTRTAGCGSGSAAISPVSAKPTSRPAACICARRPAPAGIAAGGPVLGGSGAAMDVGPRVERAAISDRSVDFGLKIAAPGTEASPASSSTMTM